MKQEKEYDTRRRMKKKNGEKKIKHDTTVTDYDRQETETGTDRDRVRLMNR